MTKLTAVLTPIIQHIVEQCYGTSVDASKVLLQKTRKEFTGDITLVVFPLLKCSKRSLEETGAQIGAQLVKQLPIVEGYTTVKGFLNVVIADTYWASELTAIRQADRYGTFPKRDHLLMVEYSSPNTNKPLHLGHLRNIFLGDAVSRILNANGYGTVRTQIVNDRGIHICKSMVAWQRFGGGATPESTGLKGDKLVGSYYVAFDQALREETDELMEQWQSTDCSDRLPPSEDLSTFRELSTALASKQEGKARKALLAKMRALAQQHAPIMVAAKKLLLKWEAKDPEVNALWEKMNGWVYDGFNASYQTMQVAFDRLYYESDTYITGKEIVAKGLSEGVFFQKEDGSVWIDLSSEGLDEKLVLRADGTAVYMTQDIGTAYQRFKDYPQLDGMVYTVGNEQDYHFNVLFLILKKLGFKWADNCRHLSYGMVDLPEGKMKSREGTVVDADDLMKEVTEAAQKMTQERGHIEGMDATEKTQLYHLIGIGALKYYLLKVDPQKRMLYDPKESLDLNGNTAPFIQYAHARIASLLRKAPPLKPIDEAVTLHPLERKLIKQLTDYPETVKQAGEEYSPAVIANYAYELAKLFNSFFQSVPVLRETDSTKANLRRVLCQQVGRVIQSAMQLLGVAVPQRM